MHTVLRIATIASLLQQPVASQPQAMRIDTMQVAILRSQLAEAKAFRSDLLQTVNVTLATIAGLGILLVGFSWFANFKVLEREKTALRAELEGASSTAHAAFQKSLGDRITEEMAGARRSVEQASVSRIAVTEVMMQSLTERIALLERRLDEVVTRQSYDRCIGEARHWQLLNTPLNEETLYREALTAAARLNDDHATSTALSNLIRLGETGILPNWRFVPAIVKRLEELPQQFTIEKQQYITLLSQVRHD